MNTFYVPINERTADNVPETPFVDMEKASELPYFSRVEQAQEFLYLLRGTLYGRAVMLYAKMRTGECFRFSSMTNREEMPLVAGRSISLSSKIMSEATAEAGAKWEAVIPANTTYILFEEAITRKTFDRLMLKMKVRMALSKEVFEYTSKNHSDFMGVRVAGFEDRWIAEQHAISKRSREMLDVFLHVPGGERFSDLTVS